MNFNYNLPVNIIFGRGRIKEVAKEAIKYGKKALIVTGRTSTKKTGLLYKISELLKAAEIEVVIFDEVEQNPLTTTAYKGANLAKSNNCDIVIGVGGGSIMDAAKAISFLAVNSGDISDYIYGLQKSDNALPIILIPTTCGTGSEGNGFAVLTNPKTNDKKSLRCNAIIAKASIIDPELMITMPKSILASVGFDALCHNMEAYLSNNSQIFTEILALKGIELIGQNLVKIYQNAEDMAGWEAVTLGSTIGGMVINTAGVIAPHGMEHPASGLRNIVHGRGLAALTPIIFEESIDSAPEKFRVISKILGGNDEFDCVDTIKKILAELNLTTTLANEGIREDDIDWIVENCLKVSSPSISSHPKKFSADDLKRIYKKAL